MNVYAETDTADNGVWVLNVEWRDEFAENNESREVRYEVQVFYTEKMHPVHNVSWSFEILCWSNGRYVYGYVFNEK